jgi:hypothetical protein
MEPPKAENVGAVRAEGLLTPIADFEEFPNCLSQAILRFDP